MSIIEFVARGLALENEREENEWEEFENSAVVALSRAMRFMNAKDKNKLESLINS